MSPIVRLLSLLSRDVLRTLADTFDVPVPDRRAAASFREALHDADLTLDDVFPELSVVTLQELCLVLDVAPAASRAGSVARVRAVLSGPASVTAASALGLPVLARRRPSAPSVAPTSAASSAVAGAIAARRSFVALDFETADNRRDSACQIAAIRVENGVIVDRAIHYVRPPRSLFLHSGVHGITWHHVRREASFGELWPRVAPIFEGVAFIAAHNAPFDRSVLNACCAAAGFPAMTTPFLCTVKLARATWQLNPARLPDVCRHLGIPLRHHDAASDAEACAHIVLAAGADRAAV